VVADLGGSSVRVEEKELRLRARHTDHIVLSLYDETTWPELTMLTLWQCLRSDNPTGLLWGHGKAMSLNEFVRFFSSGQNRALYVAFYLPDKGANLLPEYVMGFVWVDDVELGHKGFAHFWFRRKFWGQMRPQIACEKGLALLFSPTHFNLCVAYGRINAENHLAIGMLKKLGFVLCGILPKWYHHEGRYYDAQLGVLEREEFLRLGPSEFLEAA
jgi:RimJ/RimL family protein N-acetyltransferase